MQGLINSIIVRPFLRSVTWAKRNPGLTLLLILLAVWLVKQLWTWANVFSRVIGFALTGLAGFGDIGVKLADAIGKILYRLPVWNFLKLAVGWWLAFLFPPLGVFLISWEIAAHLAGANKLTVLPSITQDKG